MNLSGGLMHPRFTEDGSGQTRVKLSVGEITVFGDALDNVSVFPIAVRRADLRKQTTQIALCDSHEGSYRHLAHRVGEYISDRERRKASVFSPFTIKTQTQITTDRPALPLRRQVGSPYWHFRLRLHRGGKSQKSIGHRRISSESEENRRLSRLRLLGAGQHGPHSRSPWESG